MNIRRLTESEKLPMALLLLADPSERIVTEYVSRGECYVMDVEDKIIGTYVLLPTRPKIIELVNVAVQVEEQGRGLGKKLVRHAVTIAKSSGYRTMEVGTGNSSMNQLALYQKCGFRMTHIDYNFFVRNYDEPIFENGIQCIDMVRLSQDLS